MSHPAGPVRPAIPAGFSVQSLLPVLIFVAVNRMAGLRWAVVAATVWSLKVLIDRRRSGIPLGRFVPAITAVVLLRGAIGALTGSETVYFGLGIAAKYVGVAVLLGSVVIGRPLAARAAPYLMDMPGDLAENRRFRRTMATITAIAGVYYGLSASFDIWLFRRSTVEGFVVVRFLANWPLGVVAVVAILAVAQRGFARIPELPPLTTLIERRFDDANTTDTSTQGGSGKLHDQPNYPQEP